MNYEQIAGNMLGEGGVAGYHGVTTDPLMLVGCMSDWGKRARNRGEIVFGPFCENCAV